MKVNIGCGAKVLEGYLNVDKHPINERVVHGDLNERIPCQENSAEEVLLDNVIEHISSVDLAMREIYRILRPGGTLTIYTPHYSSQSSWRGNPPAG